MDTTQPATVQVVNLPSGAVMQVVYTIDFGQVLIAALLTFGLVAAIGSRLFDRIRGLF